jgi:hypothetical protein
VKLNRGKTPPNGWHFEVAPDVKLEAINEEELTKLIFEYRLRNNLPLGDIERDIDEYYCTRWPTACHREPKDWPEVSADNAPHAQPMMNRVARWAAMLLHLQPKGGYPLVSAEEAARRGLICVGCPHNQPWRGGCSGCTSNAATLLAQMRQTQSSRHNGSLSGCDVAGWDNQTSVWMPKEVLPVTESQEAELPSRCWRKSL